MIGILQVAIGGAVGATMRYGLGLATGGSVWTTAGVNIMGSFLIGIAFILLPAKEFGQWAPLVIAGLLGGFTTFSTFSLDVLKLMETGSALTAVVYMGLTLLLSLVAVAAGVALARGVI